MLRMSIAGDATYVTNDLFALTHALKMMKCLLSHSAMKWRRSSLVPC